MANAKKTTDADLNVEVLAQETRINAVRTLAANSDDPASAGTVPFIDQLYSQINSVLGGNSADQFLCLTIPGQALSAEDFAYDYKNNAPKGPTVQANESRLANKLFDPARMVGADNGLTLPYQYRTALDMLTPKLNEKIAVAKNQLRELLMTEYPYDFGEGDDKKYTLQEVFFRLYDDWVAESEKWAEKQNKKKEELRRKYPGKDAESYEKYNDEYLEWYETVAEGNLNVVNEKMSKVISVFTPNDMKILEGILDSGSGAELQEARQTLNNMRKLDPNGGYIYPVKFNPTNWFELLGTSFTPIDLLKTPDALSIELQTLSTRRLSLNARISEIASIIPSDSAVESSKKAADDAKKVLDDAQNSLITAYGEGIKTVLDTVFDIAPLFAGGAVPKEMIAKLVSEKDPENKEKIGDIFDSLNKTLADSFRAQQDYVNASQKLADAAANAVKTETLAGLRNVLSPLKEQLDEINEKITALQSQIQLSSVIGTSGDDDNAAPPTVPEGFTQVYISADASSLDKETNSSASSSVSTSGISFWFCGYHSDSEESSSSFSDAASSSEMTIQIGMNVAKIGIEREWFNPGVFALTKDMFNVTSMKISPVTPYTSVDDKRITDMAANNYVFPCYPTAMLLARDISVKLTAKESISSEFSSMVERHASSGGGFLLFSGSSSSSSSQSSSGVHAATKDNTITLKFDTPQIIGYYMQTTPADKSVYLDNVSGDSQAGYVTISRFVEDYKKMLEEMAKKADSDC